MRISVVISIALLLLGTQLFAQVSAQEITAEQLEKWFASDDIEPPVFQNIDVNEGELVFLQTKPLDDIHHHQNKIIIEPESLQNGWVKFQQCHNNLDKVARAQILFKKKKVKQLKIVSYKNIEQAWVENNTIQLKDIHKNAELCVTAESQALIANKDGSYSLRNGPFMRRFLDGYYPLHVTMNVSFKGTGLYLKSTSPLPQHGFDVLQKTEHVSYEAWFEGRLKTELRFHRVTM